MVISPVEEGSQSEKRVRVLNSFSHHTSIHENGFSVFSQFPRGRNAMHAHWHLAMSGAPLYCHCQAIHSVQGDPCGRGIAYIGFRFEVSV